MNMQKSTDKGEKKREREKKKCIDLVVYTDSTSISARTRQLLFMN